ncbi:CHRD domain-containing protein [Leptolyngbya sp. AN03gr2]|uniref:CHRD domain-containing protein n=1 Tax=unclassified Leptolyngbya TaxID=2650499 RepID=UPI003D31C72B
MAEFDHNNNSSQDHQQDSSGAIIESSSQENSSRSEATGSSIQEQTVSTALESIDNGDGSFTHTHADGTVETHSTEEAGDSHQHSGESGDASHDHAPAEEKVFQMSSDYTQHNGTVGSDQLIGGEGDDFIFPGEDSFEFNTAVSGEEFPFATSSDSVTTLDLSLDAEGNFKVEGEATGLDGAPLFSQGEDVIDSNAEILNGSDPEALVNGFLQVPEDGEGNTISGTHLHFSPSGDERGDFADATVVRFFENEVSEDGKSATINGEFQLSPEEQAALLAGNLYTNVHTNVDVDGDGQAGFPTGENRINFNQNVVEFA